MALCCQPFLSPMLDFFKSPWMRMLLIAYGYYNLFTYKVQYKFDKLIIPVL